MIKSKELRVGNLLHADWETGRIVSVLEIMETKIVVQDNDWSCLKHDELSPIPLTEEWMERMAFIKDRSGWHMPGTHFSLTEQFYPCWLDRMLWPHIQDFRQTSLVYVHQLQNLFHALTGEELMLPQCESCGKRVERHGQECIGCAEKDIPDELRTRFTREDPNY